MTTEAIQGYVAIGISVLALLGSLLSILATVKYSKISVIHSLQELVLGKAKDCNERWHGIENEQYSASYFRAGLHYSSTVSEVIISLQLLDNSLAEYDQKEKKEFYLKQFWTQLDTSLRVFIMRAEGHGFNEDIQKQITDIHNTFQPLF